MIFFLDFSSKSFIIVNNVIRINPHLLNRIILFPISDLFNRNKRISTLFWVALRTIFGSSRFNNSEYFVQAYFIRYVRFSKFLQVMYGALQNLSPPQRIEVRKTRQNIDVGLPYLNLSMLLKKISFKLQK